MPSLLAKKYIQELHLEPHPEGGFYRKTYQSSISINEHDLPDRFEGNRFAASAIYFLLTNDSFSAFHRLQADELWHFYTGSPITLYCIDLNHQLQTYYLGNPLIHPKASFQVHIPSQTWFAAEVTNTDGFALVGCTLSPAFDFADFELANKGKLLKEYPQYAELIERLIR